jgi:hypothetical protein
VQPVSRKFDSIWNNTREELSTNPVTEISWLAHSSVSFDPSQFASLIIVLIVLTNSKLPNRSIPTSVPLPSSYQAPIRTTIRALNVLDEAHRALLGHCVTWSLESNSNREHFSRRALACRLVNKISDILYIYIICSPIYNCYLTIVRELTRLSDADHREEDSTRFLDAPSGC